MIWSRIFVPFWLLISFSHLGGCFGIEPRLLKALRPIWHCHYRWGGDESNEGPWFHFHLCDDPFNTAVDLVVFMFGRSRSPYQTKTFRWFSQYFCLLYFLFIDAFSHDFWTHTGHILSLFWSGTRPMSYGALLTHLVLSEVSTSVQTESHVA